MLQRQSARAVGADKRNRFDGYVGPRLGSGGGSPGGLIDFPDCAARIPEMEIRILDRALSRFAGGLLRLALPGLLAGACLAGTHGSAHAARTPAQQDASWTGEKGTASYYGRRHQGRRYRQRRPVRAGLADRRPSVAAVRHQGARHGGRRSLGGGHHHRPAAVTTPGDRPVTRRRADAGDRQSGAGACLADAGLKDAPFD